jgi:hypothetical protein
MRDLTHEFLFDELPVKICGTYDTSVLVYGRAVLKSNGPSVEDGFVVTSIRLDSGAMLYPPKTPSGHAMPFEGEMFNRICDVIYNSKTSLGRAAEGEWATAVEEASQPDPDYERERRRDDAAWGGHNEKSRLEYAFGGAA